MQMLSCFARMLSALSLRPPGTTSLPQTFHWQDSEYRHWAIAALQHAMFGEVRNGPQDLAHPVGDVCSSTDC
jgi:hypothetical protein